MLPSNSLGDLSAGRRQSQHASLEATVTLLQYFHGRVDPFPITYLGIPLGLKRLNKTVLQPLVDKVANRLPSWKAGLLNRAGRTVLIKSTLSAIPTHTALAVSLSPWAIKCIDSIRLGFLWTGARSAKGGPVSWLGLGYADLPNWVVWALWTCGVLGMPYACVGFG